MSCEMWGVTVRGEAPARAGEAAAAAAAGKR